MFKDYFRSTVASLQYSFRYAKLLSLAAVVLSVLVSASPYLNSYGLKILLNYLEGFSKASLNSIHTLHIILSFAILITIPPLLKVFFELVIKLWLFKISEKIEALVLQKKIQIDIAYHESSEFQNLMQRAFHQGIHPLTDLTRHHFSMIQSGVAFAVGAVLASSISPLAFIILIVCCFPQILVQYKYGQGIWNIRSEDSPEQRRFLDLKRYFSSAEVITETKLYQTGPKLIEWLQGIMRAFHLKHSRFEQKRLLVRFGAEMVFFIGMALCLYIVMKTFIDRAWSLGNLVFAIGAFTAAAASIRELFQVMTGSYAQHLSVKDILEFMDTPTPSVDKKVNNQLPMNSAPEIIFENVWFKYPSSEQWILKGVNFTLSKGQKTALVGANGSGKSTIIKLLCKIYEPTDGKIYINGEDLNNIDNQQWWSTIATLFQESIDYYFVAKQAIAVGNIQEPMNEQKVIAAAKLSRASEFIEKWDNQYETQLGITFDGQALSRGQRQKLALAKAIYRDAFLMILDEPTTSMDADSVKFISDHLRNIASSRSLIVISHDAALIKKCDYILIIKDGLIVGQGSHSNLVDNEHYQHIA